MSRETRADAGSSHRAPALWLGELQERVGQLLARCKPISTLFHSLRNTEVRYIHILYSALLNNGIGTIDHSVDCPSALFSLCADFA